MYLLLATLTNEENLFLYYNLHSASDNQRLLKKTADKLNKHTLSKGYKTKHANVYNKDSKEIIKSNSHLVQEGKTESVTNYSLP